MHAVRRIAVAVPLLLLAAATASAEEPKPPESKEAKPPVTTTTTDTSTSTSVSYTTADGKTLKCKEQGVQSFLVRGNWFPKTNDPDKVKAARKQLEDAIKYRTEKYGYFEGFGSKNGNPHPPKHYAKAVSFMGMSAQVHEK